MAFFWRTFSASLRLLAYLSITLHPVAELAANFSEGFDQMNKSQKILLAIGLLLLTIILGVSFSRMLNASKVVSYGCFHQVAHKGSGCAAIVQKPNGQITLQLIDFQTAENSDLQILLITALDALENETVKNSEKLYVASLQKSKGFQEYVLPNGQNLTNFHSVTIWNNKHGVNFTTAPLKKF